jgi:hypothetical protein
MCTDIKTVQITLQDNMFDHLVLNRVILQEAFHLLTARSKCTVQSKLPFGILASQKLLKQVTQARPKASSGSEAVDQTCGPTVITFGCERVQHGKL